MRSLTSQAAQKLREATALLHFSIEALKESDHAAFLQVHLNDTYIFYNFKRRTLFDYDK